MSEPEKSQAAYYAVLDLAARFERSADWLSKGTLKGSNRDFPLVGLADYQQAAKLLRASAFLWAHSESEE